MTRIFTDPRQVAAMLDDYSKKQLPFALSVALNRTADAIAKAQNDDTRSELDQPTPFTQRAFRVMSRATKRKLVAVIDAMPIQAKYLTPVETGGSQIAAKVDVLRARGIPTNAYGNIPAKALARLKGNPNVFVGTVKTKAGETWGVWQRVGAGTVIMKGKYKGQKRKWSATAQGQQRGLKLLLAGNEPRPVRHLLHADRVAIDVARKVLGPELSRAITAAMRSSK